MARGAFIVLLCVAALAGAQAYSCNDRVRPGPPVNVRMTGSSFWEGFSTLNFAWDRPTDGTCIKEYQVGLIRPDGMRIQSAVVPVTIDAPGGTYDARGLPPGTQWRFEVAAVSPSAGVGVSSGQRGPFTTASPAVCDDRITPGPVNSIWMGSTATSGDFASIRFDWRRPDDKGNSFAPSCITTYDVAIFTSDGRQFVSAQVNVDPAHTQASFTANGLSQGRDYFISVTPRSPKAGNGPPSYRAGPFRSAGFNPVQPRTADEKGRK